MRTLLLAVILLLGLAAPAAAVCTTERYTPGATGVVTVTLRAASGDWDLSVFDARSGRRHSRSAFSGAREIALAAATPGRPLLARGCRRSGRSRSARIAFAFHRVARPKRTFAPQLVRVRGDRERVEALGLDVAHNGDVVVGSAAEQARLLAAGFVPEVRVADLRAETARVLARPAARPLPSGQAQYRTLAEYAEQLKGIVAEHPGIARAVVAGHSLEGRPIEGVELAAGVHAEDDGRPVFLVLGLHHAREWPSGEMPMEFALELAKGYGADPRITRLLERVRVIAIPVVNPDGFEVSRLAGPNATDDNAFATLPLIVSDTAAYKRKNCRPTAGSEDVPCLARPTVQGVDLNRNYGAFWGGVGSSATPVDQTYRGTAPYSEPESEAIHRLSSTRPIVTVISHHTFTDEGVWLRQPGFCHDGCGPDDVVPDEAGMAALGQAMADASGWRSALGWDIGEITGATEDWNYFAQGAYGYTPEQRGVNFHPSFETAVVAEFPGVREALLRAAEHSADPAFHAVLEGTAPAGARLRLTKAFDTATSQPDVVVKDALEFTLTVPASGRFAWHVNQSTRPLAATPEAYTLVCEAGGRELQRQDVVVARGERLALSPCGEAAPVAPAGQAAIAVSVRGASARALNRGRRLGVRLRPAGGTFTRVAVRLTRRGRTVARASLSRLSSARTVRLRRTARLRAGAHRLIVTASGPDGRRFASTTLVRLRR